MFKVLEGQSAIKIFISILIALLIFWGASKIMRIFRTESQLAEAEKKGVRIKAGERILEDVAEGAGI